MKRSCLCHAAAENRHRVAARLLRDPKMRRLMYVADKAEMVPLHYAAWNGHLEVVREFLRMPDPDIHVEDHTEDTPLHLAAMCGHAK